MNKLVQRVGSDVNEMCLSFSELEGCLLKDKVLALTFIQELTRRKQRRKDRKKAKEKQERQRKGSAIVGEGNGRLNKRAQWKHWN